MRARELVPATIACMNVMERWHSEREAAWLSRVAAECEHDSTASAMFIALATAAEEQAAMLAKDAERERVTLPSFTPSLRARVVAAATRALGTRRARPILAAMKVRGLAVYKGKLEPTGHAMPVSVEEIGRRHGRAGGGNLRAAVFGVNDGLVSNASLIMGVAGASSDPKVVLLSGSAGLLAGAFSMAAGEWISVRSQRELFEHQIGQERDELERYPEEEAEELALINAARGVPIEDARRQALLLVKDHEKALVVLAREELGLNPEDLGSPWGASISSFLAFAVGASLPLVPFILALNGAVVISAGLSAAALFLVGMALSLFSGRNALFGGARMLLIGSAAGAATFLVGRLLGVSVT